MCRCKRREILHQAVGAQRPVEWSRADMVQWPFEDGQFDVVVCQFGGMFFPDQSRAFAETRRVLASGGTFLSNVRDGVEENEFAHVVTSALTGLFPAAPSTFLARTPDGYHER
ncbi:class I SAM-dependent methyltransferase [Cupriavidus basilensis]|uniref:class I SAM-dependent methyltransferase n=1 Tax=Cupriavidus basilensis TaxID=68895 RepID=UPI0009DA3B30|nr:methyltransferase domain-containing protein [Cupriavidus basilensis]